MRFSALEYALEALLPIAELENQNPNLVRALREIYGLAGEVSRDLARKRHPSDVAASEQLMASHPCVITALIGLT
jgi:hypothetical protein